MGLHLQSVPARRRSDTSTAEREPATSRYVIRVRYYASLLRSSVHFKFTIANAMCGLLPDFFSGPLRARDFYDNLVIGPEAIIADDVTINLDGRVSIGRNVGLGPRVSIYTATHQIGPGSRRVGPGGSLPVTIEDGAWVRLGATVVPGVTIGRGSIVAAGAVVLRDVPPNTYVEGNPASVIGRLGWGDR
jgi:acetyltransferase-like isoleucine patch superfamily enzyme